MFDGQVGFVGNGLYHDTLGDAFWESELPAGTYQLYVAHWNVNTVPSIDYTIQIHQSQSDQLITLNGQQGSEVVTPEDTATIDTASSDTASETEVPDVVPEDDSFEPESSLPSNYELGMMIECMVRVYQRVRVRQRTNMISIERFTSSFLRFYG